MPTPYELRFRMKSVSQPEVPTNEFIEGIFRRKSMRRFNKHRKLPAGLLEYLIAAAQCSPNGSSVQSWSVIVLQTPEEKEAFRKAAGYALDGTDPNNLESFNECAAFLIWLADNYKTAEVIDIVANKEAPESNKFLDDFKKDFKYKGSLLPDPANKKLLFYPESHQEWLDQSNYCIRSMIDATIAAQTFSLCAESLGLGTLYMGSIAHCELDSYTEILKLPPRTFPVFGMCVGYEHADGTNYNGMREDSSYMTWYKNYQDNLDIKPRQPQSIVIHYGEYKKNVRQALKEYNSLLIEYFRTVQRESDYFVTKCIKKIHSTSDQIKRMIQLGNRWR